MLNNYLISRNKLFVYINYSLAFAGSLLFLIYANKIGLTFLKEYILVISLSSIFVSIIYSTSIKSKYENNLISIGITNKTFLIILLLSVIASFYLATKDFYLFIFFYLNIFYEIGLSLILIYFIKREKTLAHSLVQLFNALIKIFLLFYLSKFLDNLIIIISIYYSIFLCIFVFFFNKLGINFNSHKRNCRIIDFFFVLTGSLIFQIDKILGEKFLHIDQYFLYFIISKISSIFQIAGSILLQPARNKLISKERISININKELIYFIKLLLLMLLFVNLSKYFLIYLPINYDVQNLLSVENILIYNFFSIAFILHAYNGFYIDALFINNFSKNLLIVNSCMLFLQIIVMFCSKSLLVWSFSVMVTQIILSIYPIYKYKKCLKIQ